MTLVLAILFVATSPALAQHQAGFSRLVTVEPISGDSIPVAIWYPTSQAEREVQFGPTQLRVAPDAPIASASRHPLVLISHGTGGSEFGHWDTAAELARAGFVVAALRHPGDNYRDDSGLGTDRQIFGRSHQVAAVARAMVIHPNWRDHLDSTKVGFLGFSAGGYTGLMLLGARPDPARFGPYCKQYPSDPTYCAAGPRGRIRLTGVYQQAATLPNLRAAVLWAPALGFLFDKEQLAKMSSPVSLSRAEKDEVLVDPGNVKYVAEHLPLNQPPFTVAGAGHYVFLAPCSEQLRSAVPAICTDPKGVNRVGVHQDLNERAVSFFRAQLLDAGKRDGADQGCR